MLVIMGLLIKYFTIFFYYGSKLEYDFEKIVIYTILKNNKYKFQKKYLNGEEIFEIINVDIEFNNCIIIYNIFPDIENNLIKKIDVDELREWIKYNT